MKNLTIFLLTLIIFSSCYEVPEEKEGLKVISFENQGFEQLKADGFTVIPIIAKINSEAAEEFRTISFSAKSSAKSGAFLGDSSDSGKIEEVVKKDGSATVYFRLPQSMATIIFTASVGLNQKYKDEFLLELSPNYPDTLIIEPNELKITPNKSMDLTTYLVAFGEKKTSINTFVNFSASQKDDTTNLENLGKFLKQQTAFSMADEKVEVSFLVDSTEINLNIPIQIKAEVKTDLDSIISSMINIGVN